MNLKALLLSITIACTFAACSSDDDVVGPNQGGDSPEGTATLSVQIADTKTKAIGDTGSEDHDVSSLRVLIFNGTSDGAILESVGKADVGRDANLEVTNIPVKTGNKRVVVFANVTDEQLGVTVNATSYSDLLNKTLDFSENEVNGSLSMNSKAYEVTIEAGKENYLGYDNFVSGEDKVLVATASGDASTPVKLYRNVAKVVLDKISMKLTADQALRHPDASFEVKDVFLLHGPAKTKLLGDGGKEWGSTFVAEGYLNGVINNDYQNWITRINENVEETLFHGYLTDDYDQWMSDKKNHYNGTISGSIENNKTSESFAIPFYTYENTQSADGICVLLVVKGDFKYKTDEKDKDGNDIYAVEKNRYYSIAVGLTGFGNEGYKVEGFARDGSSILKGCLRNLTYTVSLNILGPGYDTPFSKDETMVQPTVVVVPQGSVGQNIGMGGD